MPKVKHRHSTARGRKRRTHYKATSPALTKCQQCGKAKRQHHVCPYCGYYGGREVKHVVSLEERKEKKEKKKQQR
ncbi:MAG: 50S ribosomal protein L32 [Candidatus Omnitrophota bacterium]